MVNNALNTNYPGNTLEFGGHAGIAITAHGSDWYWAVCACMTTATLVFLGLAFFKPPEHRLFHYITAGITMVASIAYFSMASNIGWAPIAVEFVRSNPKVAGYSREIFYVRYIDWFITTPLLLTDLLLTCGLPWPTILWVILVDWVMIVTGLVGALVRSSYKFGYFVFGCVALFYIAYILVWEGRKNAALIGSDVNKVFTICGSFTIFLWFLYPVAWGLCEGGNVISPDSEAIFYGVLDLFAKPVFGALLIYGHKDIDPARLGVEIETQARTKKDGSYNDKKGFASGTVRDTQSATDYGVAVNGSNTAAPTTETV